ncbi:MAG: condensation domain-containing protein [Cyanobacteria bacterium P01_D01_bin.123]
MEDGDTIYATIRGSAINNDGSAKIGYTAPSIEGQAAVIAEAMAMAEVNPSDISYVEAHGTGTGLGDPIEVAALTQAFRSESATTPDSSAHGHCGLGSVKTNLGHLDVAAGIAGLMKTALALQHRQLPPSLHYQSPNPAIDFARSPFYVNTALKDWDCGDRPRVAGVSSFGIGGTNAHVILTEAPIPELSGAARAWQLLPLSAKTPAALDAAIAQFSQHLQQHPDLCLADVAYTLQLGRVPFAHKRFVLCQSVSEAIAALAQPDRSSTRSRDTGDSTVAFLLPGQGSQHVNMGRDLYDSEPVFREVVDRCCQILQPLLGLDLRTLLYPEPDRDTQAGQRLKQTDIAQPALFVISYAWAQWWASWGIQPQMAIGHSIGEYVAACLAGVFSLEDALSLVAARGKLMSQMPPGNMVAVPLPASEVEALLVAGTAIAADNAPSLCSVAGSPDAIASFQAKLEQQGVDYRPLHTSHAFHTAAVETISPAFAAEFEKIALNPPQFPFISNLTGTWIEPDTATQPDYWVRHMRQPVRFAAGVECLLNSANTLLLEVGPGQALTTLTRKQAALEQPLVASARHPKQERSDLAAALEALGYLWRHGVAVDWQGGYAHEQRHRIPLPTYPFQRQRHWVEMSPQFLRALAGSAVSVAPQAEPEAEWSATNGNVTSLDAAPAPASTPSPSNLQESPPPRRVAPEDLPQSETEKAIAEIWKKVLGLSEIGIHDRFLDLGGDSVVGIQAIALAHQAGLKITPSQLFQYQSIAELAEVVVPIADRQAEQDNVVGSVPLTPAQHKFLSAERLQPEQWATLLALAFDEPPNPEHLQRAVGACLKHHDALRLSFVKSAGGWQAFNNPCDEAIPFLHRDLSDMAEGDREATLNRVVDDLQAELNLERGALFQTALCTLGAEQPSYVYLLVHQLVMDSQSWQIAIDDLLLAYQLLNKEQTVQFLPKTTSFKRWAEQLQIEARSDAILQERDYWMGLANSEPTSLPSDREDAHRADSEREDSTQCFTIALDEAETQALLETVPEVYHTQTEEIVLVALVQALCAWTGAKSQLIQLETTQRVPFADTDLSATVGKLTPSYPIQLSIDRPDDPKHAIQTIKEQVRAVPNGGAHYGMLRYLSPDADLRQALEQIAPEISFTYLGEWRSHPPMRVHSVCDLKRPPSGARPYPLELHARVLDSQLQMLWYYSDLRHCPEAIAQLGREFIQSLQALIQHCQTSEAGGYTPSDFSAAQIDQKDLDQLLSQLQSS